MKKSIFKITLNTLFSLFAFFIISFFILNYFFERVISIILAITFSLAISIILLKVFINVENKNRKKAEEKADKENLLNYLTFLGKTKYTKLLREKVKLTDSTVYANLSFSGINKDDIIYIYTHLKEDKKATVYYRKIDNDTKNFSQKFSGKITLVDFNGLYNEIKDKNIPRRNIDLSEKKGKFIKTAIQKKNAVKYLILGILFIIFSYFIPFRTYYVIFGIFLILISLLSVILTKSNT